MALIPLRILVADDWRQWRTLRLAALRESPDAFQAKLAEWQGDGDTEKRWRKRLADVPFNAVVERNGEGAGMVSATTPSADGETELIGMWVAPPARGHGVGDALVSGVIAWSRSKRASRIVLEVVASNEPAIGLYARHGFVDVAASDCKGSGLFTDRRMVRDLGS